METIEVKFDLARSKEMYKKYFVFERKSEFKKVPSRFLLGTSTVFILIGVYTEVDIWLYLGLIMVGMISMFLLYFYIRFEIASNRFSKELENRAIESENTFRFSFDSDGVTHESKNSTQIESCMILFQNQLLGKISLRNSKEYWLKRRLQHYTI